MPEYEQLIVSEVRDVTVVRFVDSKIIDTTKIHKLGEELIGLVEQESRKHILLSFTNVEFLSSAALNKLIVLNNKVNLHGGKLRICNLCPEIHEVFMIIRLDKIFKIHEDEASALDAF